MSDFTQNAVEVNRAENDANEGHNRVVPVKAVAVEPKPVHPHRPQPGLHQIPHRLARKAKDEIRKPLQQYLEIPGNSMRPPRSQVTFQPLRGHHRHKRRLLRVHRLHKAVHKEQGAGVLHPAGEQRVAVVKHRA